MNEDLTQILSAGMEFQEALICPVNAPILHSLCLFPANVLVKYFHHRWEQLNEAPVNPNLQCFAFIFFL